MKAVELQGPGPTGTAKHGAKLTCSIFSPKDKDGRRLAQETKMDYKATVMNLVLV